MNPTDVAAIVASDEDFWTKSRVRLFQLIAPHITGKTIDADCLARIEEALQDEYKTRRRIKKRRLAKILQKLVYTGVLESSDLPSVPSRVPRPSVLPSSPRGFLLLESLRLMYDHLWDVWLTVSRDVPARYIAFVLILGFEHGKSGVSWIRSLSRLTWSQIEYDMRIHFPIHWLDQSGRPSTVHLTRAGQILLEHIREASTDTSDDQFVFLSECRGNIAERARELVPVIAEAYDRFATTFKTANPDAICPDWNEFCLYAPLIGLYEGIDQPWFLTAYRQVPLASSMSTRHGTPLLTIDGGRSSTMISTVSPYRRTRCKTARTWTTVPVQILSEDVNNDDADWCGTALQLLRQLLAELDTKLRKSAKTNKAELLVPIFERYRERADAIASSSSALHLAIDWCEFKLIYDSEVALKSMRKYLRLTVEEGFLTDPRSRDLSTWTREDHEQIVDRMLEVPRAPATTSWMLNRLSQFYRFAANQGVIEEAPSIPYVGPWVGGSGRPWMIGLSQFDAFLRILMQSGTRENRILAVAVILGFYAGLRADEVAQLTLKDVRVSNGEVWIWVWRGKSTAARRAIPLHLLTPDSALKIVRNWVTERRCEFRVDAVLRTVGLFGPENNRDRYTYKSLIGNSIDLLKQYFGDGVDFHTLRHSFASHLFLRWYGLRNADFSQTLSDGHHELFALPACRKLTQFFTLARYDELPPHVPSDLVMISKLIGHSGLETFFATYVHSLDAVQRHVIGKLSKNLGERKLSGKTIAVLFPGLRSRTSQARLTSRTINDLVAGYFGTKNKRRRAHGPSCDLKHAI